MPSELLLTAPRSVELRSYDEAPLGPGEIRAHALVSGISHGTELALYRGVSPFAGQRFDLERRLFVPARAEEVYPQRLGYEWVGVVHAVGDQVRGPLPGALVHLSLPHRETHTIAFDDERSRTSWTLLPPGLDPERAALLQSTTIALQAVHDAGLVVGSTAAVFGLGVFGLLAVQLARLGGARFVAAVDPVDARRELARAAGADLVLDPTSCDPGLEIARAVGRDGVDVAIELSGSYAALHAALRSVRLAGRVVAAGFYTGSAGDDLRLGEELHHNRLTLVGSMSGWGAPAREGGWDRRRLRSAALDLLACGAVEVAGLLSQRVPFDRAADAYEAIDRDPVGSLRVLLTYR